MAGVMADQAQLHGLLARLRDMPAAVPAPSGRAERGRPDGRGSVVPCRGGRQRRRSPGAAMVAFNSTPDDIADAVSRRLG
jgi:hypothetical protein